MNNIDNKNEIIKLKDLINTFYESEIYEISLYDTKYNDKLFTCLSNSRVLENYENWVITNISFINHPGFIIVLYIKEE